MNNIKDFFGNILGPKWPSVDFIEIKKRARILVVDDSEFHYLGLFDDDDYTIEKWDDVIDLTKMESGYYDLILLDIQNVGKAYSAEQGFGILKHLHQVNPAQIIIAYSDADWSLKYQGFFSMADVSLAKTDDYVVFKRTVDALLIKRFSLDFYIDRVCKVVSLGDQDDGALRKQAAKAILKRNPNLLERYLSKFVDNKEIMGLALKTTATAVSLYGTLHK